MNSFIAWIGGKKLLRKAIMERFPEDGYTRYIEVFGGAGWVLFGKEPGKKLEVFNDVNSDLINIIERHCKRNSNGSEFLENSSLIVKASLKQAVLLISKEQQDISLL